MRKVSILGSTGSIRTQALDVVRANREKFEVTALACGRNLELLSEQIEEFHPQIAVIEKAADAKILAERHPGVEVFCGEEGLVTAATADCDMVLNSLMGMRGLVPTYAAIKAGKDIALANKETLVAGGEVVMDAVKANGVKMLPVDSEHSAIFQCLQGNEGKEIKKILLTASGGPFRGWSLEQLEDVTLAQALKHPKWTMGQKITIDSATMMNKGLEVIEAKWLFNVDLDQIQILVHPQSIVHSAVEFMDTSVIAQLGLPDMRIPISIALGYPERIPYQGPSLNFFKEGANLTFEEPDPAVFKCIKMAYDASRAGGSYPVVLNAANEVLVDLFLKEKIRFIDIQNRLEDILDKHNPTYDLTLEDIIRVDENTRKEVRG
jgi:1-deoxy-D-xylulose-5-phosphate reductoisomerase